MEHCIGCDLTLARAMFGRDKNRPNGLDKYCKACRHKEYLRRKDRGVVYRHYSLRVCENCGKDYQPTSGTQKLCSVECRKNPLLTCQQCGGQFTGGHKKRKYCSMECRNEAAIGRVTTRGGVNGSYERKGEPIIRVPEGTPGRRKDGRMFLSRFRVQEWLGFPLDPSDTVHHKDLDPRNCDLSNLQLRKGRHGKGAVFECGDCGSRKIKTVDIADGDDNGDM